MHTSYQGSSTAKMHPDNIESYRSLLLSVIWTAVCDACSKPIKAQGAEDNAPYPCENAASAIEFLFLDNHPFFLKYMELLDLDPEIFRKMLERHMYQDGDINDTMFRHMPTATNKTLPKNAKKSFRFNHSHWLQRLKDFGDVNV